MWRQGTEYWILSLDTRGALPFVAAEAVKERLARGEDVRTTRARREPCHVLVTFAMITPAVMTTVPIFSRIGPSLLWSNCGQ